MGELYKVVFSPQAVRDIESIVRHIALQASPQIAEAFGVKLVGKALSLEALPLRGRVVPEVGMPFREIIFRSYRIVFRIVGERVEIVRFWHAARGIPQIDSDDFGNPG
ncbi:MAG TPA: type II toxin-antitoxin system RelE/ParE family toxin [Verrucomicrobiae bacterium]